MKMRWDESTCDHFESGFALSAFAPTPAPKA